MSKDPGYVNYVRAWTTTAGCSVRRDIIAMRYGSSCYPDNVREILVGTPLGAPTTPGTARIFVRDPDGDANGAFSTRPLRLDATLPKSAKDSGYRFKELELWTADRDKDYVYVVAGDTVEAWPLGRAPYGCV